MGESTDAHLKKKAPFHSTPLLRTCACREKIKAVQPIVMHSSVLVPRLRIYTTALDDTGLKASPSKSCYFCISFSNKYQPWLIFVYCFYSSIIIKLYQDFIYSNLYHESCVQNHTHNARLKSSG